MKTLVAVVLAVFLFLAPTSVLAGQVNMTVDTGTVITMTLDQKAADTYARLKADHGDTIVEQLVQGWMQDHENRYGVSDAKDVSKRMDALTPANKQKVMDQLGLCEAGSC